jgi:hypothetical protein
MYPIPGYRIVKLRPEHRGTKRKGKKLKGK